MFKINSNKTIIIYVHVCMIYIMAIWAWHVEVLSRSFWFFKKDFISLFLERGERREKERERKINVQEIHQSVASCASSTGDLTHNPGMYCGNRTSNLSVHRLAFNLLSHISQGHFLTYFNWQYLVMREWYEKNEFYISGLSKNCQWIKIQYLYFWMKS